MYFNGYQGSYSSSKAVVLQIPYEATTSYIKGTKFAPQRIIEASYSLEEFDEELKKEVVREIDLHTLPPLELPITFEDAFREIELAVEKALFDKKKVISIGGEHSISYPIIKAYKKFYPYVSVLHIDAHADMRDSYEGTKYSHACVMRRVRELTNVVSVGVRSYSLEEYNIIKEKDLPVYGTEYSINDVLLNLSSDVYISLDFDGIDPSEMPEVGTPEPMGLSIKQTLSLIKEISKTKNIVGFDAVELSPKNGFSSVSAAKMIYRMIGYMFF